VAQHRSPEQWSGVFPACLTMFDGHGRLDEDATASHVDRLVRQGAHGVVVGGTSGEFAALNEAERLQIIRVGVAAAAGRVPVIAGTGHVSTKQTIDLTQQAAAAGADGAIVILPYYERPTVDEVVRHFQAVGRASPIPVMVYNNPANSAAPALDPFRIRDLFEAGYAQAVKSTFPTVHEVHELRAVTDPRFRVFYGSFMAPLEGIVGGAHGWISGILNVVLEDAVAMWDAAQRGDLDAARGAWQRILPIKLLYTRGQLGSVGDLAIYRGILRLRGQVGGHCRAPLLDLSDDQMDGLRALLDRSSTPSQREGSSTTSAIGGP
jgi:4-hydroxy-tetrahydrodipicolinate synthase